MTSRSNTLISYFDHLPVDWKLERLNSLVKKDKKITYGIVQPGEFDESGVLLIRGQDYMNGWKSSSGFFKVSVKLHTKFKRSATAAGDVLLSIAGYVGHPAIVPDWIKEANVTQTTARIAVDPNLISSRFLYYFFLGDDGQLQSRRYAKGSAQEGLNLEDVERFYVGLPNMLEQQKIASILTAVDEVIESTKAQINKLKDLKTGMMQELLTKGIGHTEFKDSAVGRIPKAWEVVRVGEVSKVIDSLHKTPIFCEQGWPMVRVTEIRQSNRLDMSKAAFVDEETFISFSKNYQPQIGDILVARVGAYFGSTTYIDKEMTFCLGQNTAAVRPTGVHPEYLFSFFNSQVGRTQIDESVAGSGQPSFSLKAIKELVLALPSLDEQRKISEVTDSIAQRIRVKEHQFVLYLNFKKSLMQDLLTGKIRVKTC